MKRILVLGIIYMLGISVFGQADFTPYPVPAKYRLKGGQDLPVRVNNSELKFFPPIVSQYGWSCNQSSSIGYVMTYEMNRLRDLDSEEFENQYPPLYVFNFLNAAKTTNGVSYFDSWEIVKAGGNPTLVDYPHWAEVGIWMSGYEKYYHAMQNRIIENYSLHVGNPGGLNILKHFLVDRLDGQEYGGLANFQIASGGMTFLYTDADSKDPRAPVLIGFGEIVGHALTVVGYDDEIGVDVNGDGRITNDEDNNNDGVIDMRDWEMGALIMANTWGKGWARKGFSYCLYRVLASEGHSGGIWNKSVHMIKPVKQMDPVVTMRVKMTHTSRNKFRLLAGVSTDPDATQAERVMGFPHFNYQGGDYPLAGEDPADSTHFELGLDISSLVSDIEPGQAVRFFLMVDERDPANVGEGEILEFSVINYTGERNETLSQDLNIPIQNNSITTLSVATEIDFNKVEIKDEASNFVVPGELFTRQLEAFGGAPPYLWELVQDYDEEHFEKPFPKINGVVLSSAGERNQFTRIDLPFSFPFYGKQYEELIVDEDGALHFDTEYYQYPYSINGNIVFQVRKSIVPFGRKLELINDTDLIRYESSHDIVKIFWEASVLYEEKQYHVQVGAYLYPNGRIEFHYGSFTNPPGDMYYWMSGISNGNGRSFKKATVSQLGILFKNYGVRFEPNHYPGEVNITSDGLLSCRPSLPDQIWNIYVRVRDKNNQIAVGAVPVSTIDWEEAQLLSQSYPNPFRDVTNISFLIPSKQGVVLCIYDSSGRAIKYIVNEELMAGEYSYEWDGSDYRYHAMDPGLYFYRLEVGEKWETGKLVLLR